MDKAGKLHLDDPQVRKAVLQTLTYPTTAYKDGFVPTSAINWKAGVRLGRQELLIMPQCRPLRLGRIGPADWSGGLRSG